MQHEFPHFLNIDKGASLSKEASTHYDAEHFGNFNGEEEAWVYWAKMINVIPMQLIRIYCIIVILSKLLFSVFNIDHYFEIQGSYIYKSMKNNVND